MGGTPPAIQKGASTVIMMVHNVYTQKLLHTANEHFPTLIVVPVIVTNVAHRVLESYFNGSQISVQIILLCFSLAGVCP